MGVKTTKYLTRKEAEEKYWELKTILEKQNSIGLRHDNAYLEDLLQKMNDKVNGGEGFENYIIGCRK